MITVPHGNFGPRNPRPSIAGANPEPAPEAIDFLPDQPPSEEATQDTGGVDLPDKPPIIQQVHDSIPPGTNPDRAAKVIQLSQTLNQPPGSVDRNLEKAQQIAASPGPSFFQELETKYPGSTKFLSDPKNMAVAKDDLPNVAQHEGLVQSISSAWNSEKAAFSSGALQEELAFTRYKQLSGEQAGDRDIFRLGTSVAQRFGINETDPAKRAELLQQQIDELGKNKPQSGLLKRGLYGATEFAPQILGGLGYGAKYGIPAAGVGAIAGAASGPGEVAVVPTAYGIGMAAGEVEYNYRLMSGLSYDSLLKQRDVNGNPLPDNVSKIAALTIGAASTGLSLVKLNAVLDSIPGGKDFMAKFTAAAGEKVLSNPATYKAALGNFAKQYVSNVAHGVAAMEGITAVNMAGTEAAKSLSGQPFQHITGPEALHEFGQTAEDAALTFGVLAAPGGAMGLARDSQLARKAETAKEFYTALDDTAQASKLRERLPEAHKQLISEIADGTPVKDVYVPAEAFQTYFQDKKIDPAQVADELGVRKEFDEARASGGDVKIPLEQWTDKIVGTEHHAGLADDIKFDPEDYTVREAQERRAQLEAEFKRLADQQSEQVQATKSEVSAQRVQEEVQRQLKAAGVTAAEMRFDPQLYESFFRTMGEKLGVDPYELAQKYPLTIERKTAENQIEPGFMGKVKEFLQNALGGKKEEPKAPLPEGGAQTELEQGIRTTDEGPRGRIRFGTKGSDKVFNIDLLKNADKSTFLHETGHYFLEVFNDIAKGENAPKEVKGDQAALLKWLGVEKPEDIGTEHHEKFARGFEAYLREGKAPSPGLRAAFSRFRDWLVKLYKDFKSLKVDLSDDVRGVMDRMLAAQDEIDLARRGIGYKPEEIPFLVPEFADRIRAMQDQARDQAEGALVKEQLKETTAKRQAELKEAREKLTEIARHEVAQQPLFAAMAALDGGKGHSAAARAQRYLKALEKGEGLDAEFETQAELHGFDNGEYLAKAIVLASQDKAFDRAVADRVNAGMQMHADLRSTDAIRIEALKEVHEKKMTELLALEREALMSLVQEKRAARRARVDAAMEAQSARSQAKMTLETKPISDSTDSRRYIVQERNAAVRVAQAIAKKDYAAAAEAKRQQMLSHALVSQALKNAEESEKVLRFLSKFQNRGKDLLEMPYGFAKQIDDLLFKSGLGEQRAQDVKTLLAIAQTMAAKGEDPADIANSTGLKQDGAGQWIPESLPDLVERINDNYYGLILPDSVMAGGVRAYESMNLLDLRDLQKTVQVLSEIGKKHDRFLSAFENVDIKAAAVEFANSVTKNYGTPRANELLPGSPHETKFQEWVANIAKIPSRFERWLDTMLTTCHKFDGLEEGPAKKYIYRPLEQAESSRLRRTGEVMKQVDEIFKRFYQPDEFAKFKEKGSGINVAGRTFTKEEIIAMALNWGNEGNRQRLRDGFQFSDDTFRQIFNRLDKRDWDFAQATWDHLHQYWPEIVKLEMDINGIEPDGVKPAAFDNEHGSYNGGYYPIAYDFNKSVEAWQSNQQRDALYKQYSTVVASTEQGHAQARQAYVNRPLLLSLDVLQRHHENVIHDLEYRRAVIDVRRFLGNRDVKTAIAAAIGPEGYASMNDWLIAASGNGGEPLTFWDKWAQKFRFRTTFFILGYRLLSAPKIAIENVVNLASELQVSGAARALKDYYLGESGIHETVIGKSEFMKQRAKHLDRDMGDLFDKQRGEGQSTFNAFAFFVHAYLDQGVSFPLWADSYKRGIAEHGKEELAISQADEAVKRTFMTGSRVDQPEAMRGSEKKKALTVAYGYKSMMWNRFSQQRFAAGMEWAQGNKMAAAAIAARSYVYTFAMPALTAALTGALMHNAMSDDEESKQKHFLAKIVDEATPLTMIPLLRDITPYFVHQALGEHSSVRFTPMEEAAETLLKPYAELGQVVSKGQLPEKFPEHLTNSLSLMGGVPKQFNDMVFNFIDWQNGNGELTWKDAFSRKTKK